MTTKIYLYCLPEGKDVMGLAISEDGKFLACHISSDPYWSQYDIGFASKRKHDIYNKAYPDGFELEWIDDLENHAGIKSALERNKQPNQVDTAATPPKSL